MSRTSPNRRQRLADMTPDRILHIARTRGEFSVSWCHRDDPILFRCLKMADSGLLRRSSGAAGRYYFVLAQLAAKEGIDSDLDGLIMF